MAAIENKMYSGKSTYKSGSFTTKDKTVIRDWNRTGWGWISYDQGFVYSSNTAVVNMMDKYMDADTLRAYFQRLGFGTKTGIDVPMETSGKIAFKYETEIFNAAFGQGVMTTPIQHIKALTPIANNGELLKPYVVEKIVDENGNVTYSNERTVLDTVASEETISYMKNLMWHTIYDEIGAGYGYGIKGYDIIGKTGTAQIAKPNGKGYLTGDKNHNRSISLLFPKDDPKIIIYAVETYAPNTKVFGSVVKEIITNVAKYYNIYGEEETKISEGQMELDNYLNKDINEVEKNLKNNGVQVIKIGNGNIIINQYPGAFTNIIKGDKVFLKTNGSDLVMPNVIGYSQNELSLLCKLMNIKVKYEGTGYVESQSIKEDDKITEESVLEVTMKLKF
jgi:penicillin-binding protein 2B